MSLRHVFPVFLVACATAGPSDQPNTGGRTDGSVIVVHDSATETFLDAAVTNLPDACVPGSTELLKNPAFDLTPMGTNWTETLIDPAYPIITDDDGTNSTFTEQTAPYKAWMGGIAADSGTVTDALYQDVLVPASASSLVLTGYYWVKTNESSSSTTAYDTATYGLRQTNGTTVIEKVADLSNRTPTTTWTAINHTFATVSAGQTIRLYFTSTNDDSLPTNFLFDSLSLKATVACP